MNSILKTILEARLLSINLGAYRFSPGIGPSIVTVFLLYLMIFMAQWQADKAEYKDNLRNKIEARKELPAVGLNELPSDHDERLFLPVRVNGVYDSQHYFLLDNKIFKNRVGYDIYLPLQISDGQAILVNRGFLPQGRTREDLPQFETPASDIEVRGLLNNPPSKALILADNVNQAATWPVVLQYVDLAEIEEMLGYPLFNMVLWMDKETDNGFKRGLPALKLDSAKNTGYAFQWYAMSLALLIIYIAVNTKKRDDVND